jgi:hypothetical protein
MDNDNHLKKQHYTYTIMFGLIIMVMIVIFIKLYLNILLNKEKIKTYI